MNTILHRSRAFCLLAPVKDQGDMEALMIEIAKAVSETLPSGEEVRWINEYDYERNPLKTSGCFERSEIMTP